MSTYSQHIRPISVYLLLISDFLNATPDVFVFIKTERQPYPSSVNCLIFACSNTLSEILISLKNVNNLYNSCSVGAIIKLVLIIDSQ